MPKLCWACLAKRIRTPVVAFGVLCATCASVLPTNPFDRFSEPEQDISAAVVRVSPAVAEQRFRSFDRPSPFAIGVELDHADYGSSSASFPTGPASYSVSFFSRST